LKILLVGSNKHYAIERYYVKYFKELGAEVFHFPSADIVFDFHSKNIINKVLFHSKIYSAYGPVNRQLINVAHSFNPDIIWIFKGMEIYPETLNLLRKDYKLVNYNPDHPFIIPGPGSGNANVTMNVGLFHLHFCYQRSLQQQIETEFGIQTVFLPFGFELSDDVYQSVKNTNEIKKVCFIGNPDKIRIETIKHIAEKGFEIDVYGHGWNKTNLKNHRNVTVSDAVYGSDYWSKLMQYRVQLNIFRIHNIGSHNMRTFEIPAVGGIQLAPYSKEQSLFFEEGKEIFLYKDDKSLLDKINTILALTTHETNIIRNNARQRSIISGYSYADRALLVFKTFKSLINGDNFL